MEKQNLIEKLAKTWADFRHAAGKSKIVKTLASLGLAGAFVVSAAACEITVKPDPNNPDKDITIEVDPNQNQTGNQQGGNQQGTQQGSTPGTDTPTPVEPQQPDYSKYSKMLQSILTSDYYNDLIERTESGHFGVSSHFDASFNLIEGIPYTFLENHGENIEQIKENEIRVNTESFLFDNEKDAFYHKVELTYDNGNKDYMKQYFLKYDLSNYKQEFEELKMLYNGGYYQANFLFQEIDKQIDPKNVELISEFCINEDTYKGMVKAFNESSKIKPTFKKDISDFILLDAHWNENKKYAVTALLLSKLGNGSVTSMDAAKAIVNYNGTAKINNNNNILSINYCGDFKTQEISETTPFTRYHQEFPRDNLIKTV